MLAKDVFDSLCALEDDLKKYEVIIRYRDGSYLRELGVGRTYSHDPQVEVVLSASIEVTQCNCEGCRSSEDETPAHVSIPLWKVTDVDVSDFGPYGTSTEELYDYAVVARWLRSRYGRFKRIALDD
jgi:hypothetical protein